MFAKYSDRIRIYSDQIRSNPDLRLLKSTSSKPGGGRGAAPGGPGPAPLPPPGFEDVDFIFCYFRTASASAPRFNEINIFKTWGGRGAAQGGPGPAPLPTQVLKMLISFFIFRTYSASAPRFKGHTLGVYLEGIP